ncbi:MAG: hemerythrin family protein [Deltaproteobacteria bacterium]|nr:hemerythrin family protein [Deltaproteobacteria bacterium]MBW1938988.1 hemerythrin family protein [Deltaproteobacteria bacterium]
MAKIEWDESLSICVELVDEQHKMLIEKLNDINQAIEQTLGAEKILKTLDFMVDYADFHFSTEEKHMIANEYPGYQEHKKAHEEFKGMINSMIEDFKEDGATEGLAKSINTFLMNWLVKHIKGADQEFGNWLDEKGLCLTE